MRLEELLHAIDADQPCGSNLEYDPDFLALEQASLGRNEQQYGTTIIPAQAPDWLQVEGLALGLMARTKDLRVILHLCLAWTHLQGLEGYAEGLQLLLQAMNRYPQDLFPQLDFEGAPDPFFRTNALAALSDHTALGQAVQSSILLKTTGGAISLREAYALFDRSKIDGIAFPGGRAHLIDILANPEQAAHQTLQKLAHNLAAVRATIQLQLGEAALPPMQQLDKTITALAQVGTPTFAPSHETLAGTPENIAKMTLALPNRLDNGSIHSRADALQALRQVQAYFRLHEPSHPAPLMLDRVQRLIALDFLQILQDLAPDCLVPVKAILGQPEPHHENGTLEHIQSP